MFLGAIGAAVRASAALDSMPDLVRSRHLLIFGWKMSQGSIGFCSGGRGELGGVESGKEASAKDMDSRYKVAKSPSQNSLNLLAQRDLVLTDLSS